MLFLLSGETIIAAITGTVSLTVQWRKNLIKPGEGKDRSEREIGWMGRREWEIDRER